MADEDLALEGDGAQAEETPDTSTEEQREPTASELAADMGWKPKDQWTGDPDAWKPAADFIRAGRDIQQGTARELKAMREQVERLGSTTTQIIQDKIAERDSYWQTKFDEAVEAGDTDAARKAAKELNAPAAKPTQGPDATTQAWIADNPWFNTHPRAKALASRISVELAQQGEDVATQLKEARAEVQQRYPELFKTTKAPPATQTGQSRTSAPSNRVKGFADMPQASQQAALDMERRGVVKKEAFAQSYWAEQTKEGVSR